MPLTDIQRIELACRRLAARERGKIKDDTLYGTSTVDFGMIKFMEALADELAEPEQVADNYELESLR